MTYTFAPNDEPLFVDQGDYVQFRFKAPNNWNTTETVRVEVGELVQFWLLTTIPEDFTPDPFPFLDYEPAALDTRYVYGDGNRPAENIITVSGLTPTTQAPIRITSSLFGGVGLYSLRIDPVDQGGGFGPWIQPDGSQTVQNGDRVQIRSTSSEFPADITRTTLTIGTSSSTWEIVTQGQPQNIPFPFPTFTDLVDQPTNTLIYSDVIRIQGLIADAFLVLNPSTGATARWAVSSQNVTTTNAQGFAILNGVTFSENPADVSNGDYLQLQILSSPSGLTPVFADLTIGDGANLSTWTVTTDNAPSTSPTPFQFNDRTGVPENTLIQSNTRTITGLGVPVEVSLLNTDSAEVGVKINDGSVGTFPVTVENNDTITVYMRSSAVFSEFRELTIRVGTLDINPWTIQTNAGPDTDAIFTPPANKINQFPNTFISSSAIIVEGINRPITISATNNALISIDFDTPSASPRIFNPNQNTSFYISLLSADQLSTPEFTVVTVGTGIANNPFTWTVTTFANFPLITSQVGQWYSNKTFKFDGYTIGTVLPILKETVGSYGDIDDGLDNTTSTRYPGFLKCEGQSLNAARYPFLFDIIGNNYGGNGIKDFTGAYSGTFNLPDYRMRRLCGVGFVDASQGNSAFLPVTGSGLSIQDPGGEGGYWYFDRVDTLGQQPLEQLEGTGNTSLISRFFSLGTVKISNLESITDSIIFNVTGSINGIIGPMDPVVVVPPVHNHFYISAIPAGDSGDPVIKWGNGTGRGMFGVGERRDEVGVSANDDGSENREAILAAWASWIRTLGTFETELRLYYGSDFNLNDWVEQNLPSGFPVNEESPGGGVLSVGSTDFGPESNDQSVDVDFLNWWISSITSLPNTLIATGSGSLSGLGNTGNYSQPSTGEAAAVIDTREGRFLIDAYLPPNGTTFTHSHKLTEDTVGNLQTDFTGGNVDGSGEITLGGLTVGSGLGNASDSISVEFVTGSGSPQDLFMDMTDGIFQFTTSVKKPIPDVTMRPQRQVPIINAFHKTKYIIKAF
jgi:hypothetical protein